LEAHERRRADSVKFITAVVSAAPKFDGSGILGFWESAIRQHMTLSQVRPEQQLQVARLCLEGPAKDYVYASGIAFYDLEELMNCL
jgi:hypothetical protein